MNNFIGEIQSLYKYKLYNMALDGVKDGGNYIVKDIIKRIQMKYGKEISIKDGAQNQTYAVYNWIKKFDKDFNKRAVVYNTSILCSTRFFINLDENTFAYITTGQYCSDKLSLRLYSDRNDENGRGNERSNISVYIFGKYCKKYIAELEKVVEESIKGVAGDQYMYNVSSQSDGNHEDLHSVVSKLNTRDINTLFYNKGILEGIISHIDNFIANDHIYKERNLLYKTGILLYGEPGTGKTSLASALATKYGYDLIVVDMGSFETLDLNTLTNCINCDTSKFIILLEDIDTLFNLDREKDDVDKDDKKVINKMLQFLDSNSSPTEVIFLATTNHIDKLDRAILRSGRFDYKAEVKSADKEAATEMCRSFNVPEDKIAEVLGNTSSDDTYNQSTLQNEILNYFKTEMRKEVKFDDVED